MSWFSGFSYSSARLLSLFRRTRNSLNARGLRGTMERIDDYSRPAWLRKRKLQRYAAPISPSDLRLPHPDQPRASIIIPVYGQLPYTLRCLNALMHCADATAFEVIVVDDCSPDNSAAILAKIPGLRYQRNTNNLGFIASCNAGARSAAGEFLLFLNNDTMVQPGWLDALLSTFISHPDTGLVGSKLLYPDGRLQEAGAIVFADGSAWNVGRFGDPDDPRYNFVREVDYCSGAALAMKRELFNELGGFDAHYAPAYYEDTDLAMRVRQHGLKVRYQPASEVAHVEGISSGTDIEHGTKAYQKQNHGKFLQRWRQQLSDSHPAPASRSDITAAATHWSTHRVLLIDVSTPMPDRDAGSVRLLELMQLLLDEGCALSFFAENLAHDGRYSEALQQIGVETWSRPWLRSIPRWLKKHGPRFDLIIVSRHYVLTPLLPLLRKFAPQARIVFDTVDLHFLRESRQNESASSAAGNAKTSRTREAELKLIQEADITWVVSDYEKSLLAELLPNARIDVVSTIHRPQPDTPGFVARNDLIFVGSYRHPPNVDAALWLAQDIFPLIRKQRPDIGLHLVGSYAPEAITALGQIDGIVFHGYVADLDVLLDSTRISLAPLRYGAGVKGKVNQSLARGLPTVATTCAVEGMHVRDGMDALIGDSAEQLANAVLRLYDDPDLWQRLREGGLDNTRRYFSRDSARETLRSLLAELPEQPSML